MSISRRIFLTNTIFIFASLLMLMLVNTIILNITSKEIDGRYAQFEQQLQDGSFRPETLDLENIRENQNHLLRMKNLNLLSSIITIVLLCFTSLFVSRWLKRQIMIPLDMLSHAAQRVEKGEWSELIHYSNKDEYTNVCNAFDKMQLRLQEDQQLKQRYEDSRTEMIAGISHDLRTPLTSIRGFMKGIMDGVADTPEKQQQYLSIAYNKSYEIEVLLQRLMDLSSMEFGTVPMLFEQVDFANYLKDYIREKKQEFGDSISFSMEFPARPIFLSIDKGQIHRVLENLIDNSRKYAKTALLEIHIIIKEEQDKLVVEFKDNGQGVPIEELPFLFDRFWRSDKARAATSCKGNGLGLSIIKHIIHAHKGSVYATMEDGFTIVFCFPKELKGEFNE